MVKVLYKPKPSLLVIVSFYVMPFACLGIFLAA